MCSSTKFAAPYVSRTDPVASAPGGEVARGCRAHKSAEDIPHKGYCDATTTSGKPEPFAVAQPNVEDGEHSVRDLSGAGAPQRIGWFRFYFDDGRWEWSPQVAKMHGYPPGTITPTTEIVLAHKHPDEYRQIADTLDLIRQTRQPFSSRHRIIDVHGRIHHVVVVGDLLRGPDHTVIGTHGYFLDP